MCSSGKVSTSLLSKLLTGPGLKAVIMRVSAYVHGTEELERERELGVGTDKGRERDHRERKRSQGERKILKGVITIPVSSNTIIAHFM